MKKNDLKEIFDDSDAVVILTEWDEYSKLNWELISNQMRSPIGFLMLDLLLNQIKF